MSTTFGSYIHSLRTQNGMTQAQLADRLCVTDKAVSKWERDLSYPDITLFPRLADLLGVTVDDLLRESKNGGQPSRLLQIFEMSHDIRTPLHIILGCANMASLHHEDTALLLRYLESIRISGEYLLQVIDRVMDVTHQEQKDPAEKASIPIIAVSANDHERERKEALDAGMNAFAEKPIFIDRLFAAMAKFL